MTPLQDWQREFETKLKEPYGWLSLTGLFWLDEGDFTLGTSADNDFVLEADPRLPPRLGLLSYQGGQLLWTPEEGAPQRLHFDNEPHPTELMLGELKLTPIRRGHRAGVRARNPHAQYREHFAGLRWYAEDPSWRVTARFEKWDRPRPLSVVNALGDAEPSQSLGLIRFTLAGVEHEFHAEAGPRGGLFVNFRDGTTGRTTYPAGRFLYTDPPVGDTVVLDFGHAHSPPCARTPWAVCPRPVNVSPVAIEAGELFPDLSNSPH